MLACVFSAVVIAGCPSDAIITYYNFHFNDKLIEGLSVASEIGIVTFSCGSFSGRQPAIVVFL
jgi:hypothetical protein